MSSFTTSAILSAAPLKGVDGYESTDAARRAKTV